MDESAQTGVISEATSLNGTAPGKPGAIARARSDWKLFLWWIGANTVGVVIGAFSTEAITNGHGILAPRYFTSGVDTVAGVLQSTALTGLLFGAIVGLAEWLVLKMYMPGIILWIPATSIGWALSVSANWYLSDTMMPLSYPPALPVYFFVVIYAVRGVCTGLPQALALWGRLRWSSLWIVGNILAWLAVLYIVPLITGFLHKTVFYQSTVKFPTPSDIEVAVFAALMLLSVEVITGGALLFLLRHTVRRSKPTVRLEVGANS